MHVKTFIYGTPLGFNFYEDDSQYKDYFKGFYISSREGRHLMVNRLDNGETTYNFLCYRIAENRNRPNAFFGMSLVLGDYQYCSDFSKLYDWFDFLFDKLVNKRSLFKLQGDELQYNVSKFEDDREDVEWLKSNLPNILSSPDIKLQKYDASFSNNKTGRIPQFNNRGPIDKVLKAFKQSRWISLSPVFEDEGNCLELDFGELSQVVESITKELLPIAIEPEQKHLALLHEFVSVLKENYKSITEFVEKTKDDERKKQFAELGQRYYSILTKELPQIAEKIKGGVPPSPTRICSKCGLQKPLNEFASGDTICTECRAHESTRVCEKCGQTKPLNAFKSNDPICKSCRNEETSEFVLPFPKKYLWGGVAVIAVLAIFIVGIQKFIPKPPVREHEPSNSSTVTNSVDEQIYQGYISNSDFSGAYNYINEKENAQEYKLKLKESYEQFLLSLTFEQIQQNLIKSYDLCTLLEIDKNTWDSYVTDGNKITVYLGKSSISTSDRKICQNLINKYQTGFYQSKAQEWNRLLAGIPNLQNVATQKQGISVKYRINDGKILTRTSVNNCIGFELRQGDYVDIFDLLQNQQPTCDKFQKNQIGWHSESTPPYYRISTKNVPNDKYLFQCGENCQITITIKARYQAQ